MERTKSYTPLPPSSGQRTEGYSRQHRTRPSSSSFTHSHASTRAPSPRGQTHNPHHIFSFSSYSMALWRPTLSFWEIKIKQNALQTRRCGGLFWAQEKRVHCCPITMSWGYEDSEDPLRQHSIAPLAEHPRPLWNPTFPWPLHSTWPFSTLWIAGTPLVIALYFAFTLCCLLFSLDHLHCFWEYISSRKAWILSFPLSSAAPWTMLGPHLLWEKRRRHSLWLTGFPK